MDKFCTFSAEIRLAANNLNAGGIITKNTVVFVYNPDPQCLTSAIIEGSATADPSVTSGLRTLQNLIQQQQDEVTAPGSNCLSPSHDAHMPGEERVAFLNGKCSNANEITCIVPDSLSGACRLVSEMNDARLRLRLDAGQDGRQQLEADLLPFSQMEIWTQLNEIQFGMKLPTVRVISGSEACSLEIFAKAAEKLRAASQESRAITDSAAWHFCLKSGYIQKAVFTRPRARTAPRQGNHYEYVKPAINFNTLPKNYASNLGVPRLLR